MRKCRAGADFAITQMFFDADDYLRLRDRVAAAGCDTPIIAGHHAGDPASARSSAPSSCPARRSRRRWPSGSSAVADDPEAVRALGIEQASRDVRSGCSPRACPGIHFITLNRSTATREVWQNLGRARV